MVYLEETPVTLKGTIITAIIIIMIIAAALAPFTAILILDPYNVTLGK